MTPVPAQRPIDRGLARERTELAWNRSGLAVAACIAVILRHSWPLHGTGEIIALACMSAGAFVWALALSVGRAISRKTEPKRGRLSQGRAGAITVATLAIALGAFVLAFLPAS